MKRTSDGYKLYKSSGLTELIHEFKRGGSFHLGGKVKDLSHFMWAINLGTDDNSIFLANNLTSKKKHELFMEFKLEDSTTASGMITKVVAPSDLIYMKKVENLTRLDTDIKAWADSSIAEYSAVLSLFDQEINYKILQKSNKTFGLVDGNIPLVQFTEELGYEMNPKLSYTIEKSINYKLLLDYSNLSEIEKSYFNYAYILDNPKEFEDLSNILLTNKPFYKLDTKLKDVINPNDYIENIID